MRISDWSSDVCSSDLTGNDGRPVARSCGGRGAYRIGNDVRPCPRRWRQAFQAVAGLHHDRVGPRIKLREDLRPKRMRGLPAGIVPFRYDDGERHSTARSEEHTSELQSLMRMSYGVFCLKKKKTQ